MEKTRFSTFAIFIGLFFLLVYLPTAKTPFLMDDSHTVENNQFVHSLRHFFFAWTSGKSYSSTPDNYGYRPLTVNLSQMLWFVGNGHPLVFQIGKKILLAILGLIVATAWVEFGTIILKSPNASIGQLMQSALFKSVIFGTVLLHPGGAQVANYVSASSTLLCGIFYFLGLLMTLKFHSTKKIGFIAAACLSYFFSMMSKEEGVTLIAVIAILEYFYLANSPGILQRLKELRVSYAFIPVAAAGTALIYAQFEPTSDLARHTVSRGIYFATQWHAYYHYFWTFLWPVEFNFDNLNFPWETQVFSLSNILLAASHILMLGQGAYLCWRKNPWGLIICGFYLAILPASSIIPLAEPVNDHRAFLSYMFLVMGFSLVFCYVVEKYWSERGRKYALISAMSFLGVGTLVRNFDFVSGKAIWLDTVLKNPKSPRAKNNLALEYMAVRNYSVARELLLRCIDHSPTYWNCHTNIAIVSAATGEDSMAEKYFHSAMRYDRGYLSSRIFYSEFLIKRGRYREALTLMEEADRFASGLNQTVRASLSHIKTSMGRNDAH